MIAIVVAKLFPWSDKGNQYLQMATDCTTRWPEAYSITNQAASSVADALVTIFFCRFGVPRELHRDQGQNFDSLLLQEVLHRLGVSKTRTAPLHPESDMVEC